MNAGIIAKQMLVLFLIMMVGYAAFKKGIVSREGAGSISSSIINIFNPCLIISGVLNKKITYSRAMVTENLILVVLFFAVLIILSKLFAKIMKLEHEEVNCYRLMMIFPNLGFMGIPLVRGIYGQEAVILVAFYIVGYNLLVYSYGIILAMGAGTGEKRGLPFRKILNIGTASCAAAIFVFAFHVKVPEVVETFVDTVGSAAVPLSMITVGIMVAQSDLKELVTDRKQLTLSFISLLVTPALCIPVMKLLPLDPVSYGIFILLMAMPVGSVVMMVEKEYGITDGSISAKSIALTSVLSVITIPLITFLA